MTDEIIQWNFSQPTPPLYHPLNPYMTHPTLTPIGIILNLGLGKSNIYYFPPFTQLSPTLPLHDPPHPCMTHPTYTHPPPIPHHHPPQPTWPTPPLHDKPQPHPTPGIVLGTNGMNFMGSFTMSPFWLTKIIIIITIVLYSQLYQKLLPDAPCIKNLDGMIIMLVPSEKSRKVTCVLNGTEMLSLKATTKQKTCLLPHYPESSWQ